MPLKLRIRTSCATHRKAFLRLRASGRCERAAGSVVRQVVRWKLGGRALGEGESASERKSGCADRNFGRPARTAKCYECVRLILRSVGAGWGVEINLAREGYASEGTAPGRNRRVPPGRPKFSHLSTLVRRL